MPTARPAPLVAIEATSAARREPSGAGRYARGIVAALLRRSDPLRYRPIYKPWRLLPRALRIPRDPERPGVPGRPTWLRRAALVHILDLRPWIPRRPPAIVTVFDLFSLEHEDLAPPRFRRRKLRAYALAASRAARIVTLTEPVARRFAARFPAGAGRIRTIPPGLAPAFGPVPTGAAGRVLARLGVERPYVLAVGEICARKALPVAAAAVGALRARGIRLRLVVAGRRSWGAEEALRRARRSAPLEALGYVADPDLAALYAGAEAVVIASVDEGFGLPALEAMACSTPVLAADIETLRETCGRAALYARPGDAGAFARALLRLEEDADLRERLRRRGRSRAAAFRWDAAADAIVGLYREVLRETGGDCAAPGGLVQSAEE